MTRELLKMALDALNTLLDEHTPAREAQLNGIAVMDALRAYLAQPEAEPAPQAPVLLTPREVELLDGMINVQLHHAAQCDGIANRTMADKQKGWDMERVALLSKLRAHGIRETK